ncbi:MAG: ABC transporter substrate-binding protein [Oscillospiraceae bacterium]|nr:ABC transporter substrate-binding protein [Oscillospiraceae bacterium]
MSRFKRTIAIITLFCVILTTACGDNAGDTVQDNEPIVTDNPSDTAQDTPGITVEENAGFTWEELQAKNTIDGIFAVYSSVEVESEFYGMDGEDFTQTTVHVKRDDGITAYTKFDIGGGEQGYMISPDGMYYYGADGSFGKYVFFNDGAFEEYYLPNITDTVILMSWFAGTLVSSTVVRDNDNDYNTQTVVWRIDVEDTENVRPYGYYEGVLETTLVFEADSGFLLSEKYHVIVGDERPVLLSTRTVTYGQHDDYPEPEYVLRGKDMSETRTVTFIMPGGETFVEVVPIDAGLQLSPIKAYWFFEDEEMTVYYEYTSEIGDGYPTELTVYAYEVPDEYLGDYEHEVILYTSMKDSLIDELAADFMELHPDTVVRVRIDGAGNLMARIEEQVESGQILADVIWTSEIPDFYDMKDRDLLLQYRPVGAENVLNTLDDSDDYFLPARLGTMGIAYNTDLIDTPPESWSDLTKPEYTDSFAIANPQSSGTALMAVIKLNEAFGMDFFSSLKANGAFIGGGATAVIEAVAEGEIAACLAVDYITFDKAKTGSPIALAYPEEMLVIPSPVAIFKDAGNTDAAKKFVDYLVSARAQEIIASNGTLPVLQEITVPSEFNIPPVGEAMARKIQVYEPDMIEFMWDVVGGFLGVMG